MMRNWQRRRSAFNHDWLAREYIGRVASFLQILDGEGSDPDVEAEFLRDILPQWEKWQKEAMRLPVDFMKEMSPKSLFEQEPLCRCDEDTMGWLPELIDQLWWARYPVGDWIEKAQDAAQAVNVAYWEIVRALDRMPDRSPEALKSLRSEFAEFHKLCQALSKAISAFPHEVLVI